MSRSALIARSGVSRATVYRILKGEGAEADEVTLGKLAHALDVVPPRIARVLLTEGEPAAPAAPSPLQLLREARAIIRRAESKLRAGEDPGDVPPNHNHNGTDVEPEVTMTDVARALEAERALEALPPPAAPHHRERQRRKRG